MRYTKGQVAFVCGMMLLFGHFAAFVLVWTNEAISPTSKNDIVAIIVPMTVASVASAVLYAMKHGEIDLRLTPKVNIFFLSMAIFVPIMFFAILLGGLWGLNGDPSVDTFKIYIVTAEATFGGLFVIVTEALFGGQPPPLDPADAVNDPVEENNPVETPEEPEVDENLGGNS